MTGRPMGLTPALPEPPGRMKDEQVPSSVFQKAWGALQGAEGGGGQGQASPPTLQAQVQPPSPLSPSISGSPGPLLNPPNGRSEL